MLIDLQMDVLSTNLLQHTPLTKMIRCRTQSSHFRRKYNFVHLVYLALYLEYAQSVLYRKEPGSALTKDDESVPRSCRYPEITPTFGRWGDGQEMGPYFGNIFLHRIVKEFQISWEIETYCFFLQREVALRFNHLIKHVSNFLVFSIGSSTY